MVMSGAVFAVLVGPGAGLAQTVCGTPAPTPASGQSDSASNRPHSSSHHSDQATASTNSPSKPDVFSAPQTVTDAILRDHDYGFELYKPAGPWTFLPEAKAQGINPKACAGLANFQETTFLLVIPEELPSMTHSDYASRIVSSLRAIGVEIHNIEELNDLDPPRFRLTGMIFLKGMHGQFITELYYFRGFGYQVFTYGTPPLSTEVLRHRALGQFRLLTDMQPRHRSIPPIMEDAGTDWRIHKGIYENASFGHRLTPPEGWRAAGEAEATSMRLANDGLLISDHPTIAKCFFVRPTCLNGENELETAIIELEDELSFEPQNVHQEDIVFAGSRASRRTYFDVDENEMSLDYRHTLFLRNDRIYRLLEWWPSGEREKAIEKLAESDGCLSFLNEHELVQLTHHLESIDPANAVGKNVSLRNRTFRDYKNNVIFQLPEGVWFATLDAIDQLHLFLNRHRIDVLVVPFTPNVLAFDDHHHLLVSDFDPPEELTSEKSKKDNCDVWTTSFSTRREGKNFEYYLYSISNGTHAVSVVIGARQCHLSRFKAQIPSLLAGIEFSKEELEAVTQTDHHVVYDRFGFSVSVPVGEWTLTVQKSPVDTNIEGSVLAKNGTLECIFGAVVGKNLTERIILESVSQSAKIESAQNVQLNDVESGLAGRPSKSATMTTWIGLKRKTARFWCARRGNTTYWALLRDETGILNVRADEDLDRHLELFSLID
jgi:hypothetical protein